MVENQKKPPIINWLESKLLELKYRRFERKWQVFFCFWIEYMIVLLVEVPWVVGLLKWLGVLGVDQFEFGLVWMFVFLILNKIFN